MWPIVTLHTVQLVLSEYPETCRVSRPGLDWLLVSTPRHGSYPEPLHLPLQWLQL